MSIKNAKEFLEQVSKDEKLLKNFNALKNEDQKDIFFKENGYDFTKEELKIVMSELSDDDLDGVAGGVRGRSNHDYIPI